MTYVRPATLQEAFGWLSQNTGRVAAGCTDLFALSSLPALPGAILDITAIPALRGVTHEAGHWRFGAATTWSQIIRAELPPCFDALKLAAREVGAIQIQTSGTIGGNICNASPAADGMPPLLILDARVEIASAAGKRTSLVSDFVTGPRKTALRPGEIATAILVPDIAARGASTFIKLGARKSLVISIAMVAARLVMEDGIIRDAAISVGACGPVAARLHALEQALTGCPARNAQALATRDLVHSALSPIDDIRADATYRAHAATELVRRAIASLAVDAA